MRISSLATRLLVLGLVAGLSSALAQDAPSIVTRQEWQANPPVLAMKANQPVRLTIHHTATKQNFKSSVASKLRSLQAFSQKKSKLADGRTKKAWGDVPYHFYVDAKGVVAEGREVQFAADTNTDYDPSGHLTVVVEGNFEKEQPTPAQIEALESLLVFLSRKYGIDPSTIGGHRDYASTACPGKNLIALLPDIRKDVSRRLSGTSPAELPGKTVP